MGMTAIVLCAAIAPVKVVDRQKSRQITLPKQVMTLDELAEPVQHGWDRFYYCYVNVPEGLADHPVRFPSRELTVGEFIAAIEAQTPLRHRFHHCGNGHTVLWGGDCSFGLHFRPPAGYEPPNRSHGLCCQERTVDGPWQGWGFLTGFGVKLGATDRTGTQAARGRPDG
jgi:hypothetical protein